MGTAPACSPHSNSYNSLMGRHLFTRVAIASILSTPSPMHAQNAARWPNLFALADTTIVEPKPVKPCYGHGRQPDSVALTVAPVASVEYGTAAGWRPAGASGWVMDTIVAALRSVECMENGEPQFATVERGHRFLRLNVMPLPGQPPDIIRERSHGGGLLQVRAVSLPNDSAALLSTESLAAAQQRAKREEAKRDAAEVRVRRKALLAKGWPKDAVDDIVNGYVRIGFTPAMVTEALGEPDHVNVTVSEYYGKTEQWVYGLGAYIYFRHGRVTSMSFTR